MKTPKSLPHQGFSDQEEHRSRAPEFYGFVAWTSTYFLFILYILWAVLPDDVIISLGVTWYPNREWALLVPSWTIMVVILTYITYSSLAIRGTPSFDEMRSVTDSRISLPSEGLSDPYIAASKPNAIPELYDIPIGMVNRVLYHEAYDTSPPTPTKRSR